MRHVDIIVIGGGIAGLTVGHELAADHSVLILERETAPHRRATGSAAAILSQSTYSRAIRILTAASRTAVATLAPPGATSWRRRPLLVVAGPDRVDELGGRFASLGDVRPATRWITSTALETQCPVLRPGAFAGAVLEPGAMEMDVTGLYRGFLIGFAARGGVVRTGARVTGIERHDDRWFVLTADGTVQTADLLVDAAGAHVDEIAALAGVSPLGLTHHRRTQFVAHAARPLPATLPMVVDAGGRFYFRTLGTEVLCSPMDEHLTGTDEPSTADHDAVRRALVDLESCTTLSLERVTTTWGGLRTFAEDRLPVVGFPSVSSRFLFVAGLGDYGLQVAPALARLAGALVRDAPLPTDLIGIDPEQLAPRRLRPNRTTSER